MRRVQPRGYLLESTHSITFNSQDTMALLKSVFVFLLTLGTATAFAPAKNVINKRSSSALNLQGTDPAVYEEAVADFENQFPQFAKWGWGPSVQAEKWNGRHAMFGWLFICASAYCHGHGLIPDPDKMLTYKQWGALALVSGKDFITNERAVILMANAHFFGVSLMATICPLPFGDPLLLDPNHPNYDFALERSKNPFGYMPELNYGLTEEAEILNGRLAMVGLAALIMTTAISGKPMLDIVNEWVGGAYY